MRTASLARRAARLLTIEVLAASMLIPGCAVVTAHEGLGHPPPVHCAAFGDTASFIKADILAVLLVQRQQIGAALSLGERRLAAAMIEAGDNDATTALWDDAEGGMGVEAGNAVLGLAHTRPSPAGTWVLTRTTVADRLRLLTDLTSARSPLGGASRAYELDLIRHARADCL